MPQERSQRAMINLERFQEELLQGPCARTSAQSYTRRAADGTAERFQSTSSSSQSLTGIWSNLASQIEAVDILPIDWNLSKRKRLSEGDIADLQEHLELEYCIRHREPRRPSELDPTTLLDADLQRTYRNASNLVKLARNPCPSFLQALLQWTQKTSRSLSASWTSWQGRTMDPIPSYTQSLHDSVLGLLEGILRFLYDCTVAAGRAWNMGWPVFRLPLIVLVTFFFGLNAVAFSYTITHEAFLSNFCVKELPLVRNWMCSARDKRLESIKGVVEGTGRFTDPLGSLLLRNGSVSSFMFPHIPGRYETIVRSFRVNLPVSQFSANDQAYLREQFTEFIHHNSATIRSSQELYAHIIGTISRSISNSQYYVDKFSEYNTTSFPPNEGTFELTFETDGSLPRGMAWFNSHYMVFLPAGLEPFRHRVVRLPYLESIQGLQKHIATTADRLVVDIDMALALQAQMKAQRGVGEKDRRARCGIESGEQREISATQQLAITDGESTLEVPRKLPSRATCTRA